MGMKTHIVIIILLLMNSQCFAAWIGQGEVVRGVWGEGDDDFGIRYQDSFDRFPQRVYLSKEGKIIVRDIVNGRRKVYTKDQLIKITKCQKTSTGDWNEECNILGDYLSINKDGNIWTKDNGQYRLTSPTGGLIASHDQKPLELGEVSKVILGEKTFKVVKYENVSYYFPETYLLDDFVRDNNNYLYTTNSETVDLRDFISATVYTVNKYDQCGRLVGQLQLPISDYWLNPARADAPGDGIEVREEYGPPVIGPDGSIYCWKRTPDTYSILKWEWVDDPSDPKPGPDMPDNFHVIPATQGIYVTWNLSPQDPGCVDTYQIERATSVDGIYTTIATVDKGEQSYNDANALQGQNYYYRLRAVADDLYSDFTNAMGGKWTGQ